MSVLFRHDPQEHLDYSIDWSGVIPSTDAIAEVFWSSDDPALTVTADPAQGMTARVWVSGGVVGATYRVTCQVHTWQGRIAEQSLVFRAVNK